MKIIKQKFIVAVAILSMLTVFLFASSALAAQVGDTCDPSASPPSGFSCTNCVGSAQAASCTLVAATSTTPATAPQSQTQSTGACSKPSFFFLPPWYEYLNLKTDQLGSCVPDFSFPNDIWAVVMALIDMLLRLAGFVAIISIIIAGTQYVFSGGTPEKAMNARWRLYNSLIGLAIVSIATAVVTFIGKQFT